MVKELEGTNGELFEHKEIELVIYPKTLPFRCHIPHLFQEVERLHGAWDVPSQGGGKFEIVA